MIYVDLIECVGKDLEHELQKLTRLKKKVGGYCEIISVAPSLIKNTPQSSDSVYSEWTSSFVTGWAVVWRDTHTQEFKWKGGAR